jgi:hypothetical protein
VLMLVTMLSFVFGEARLGHIHLLGTTSRPSGDSFCGATVAIAAAFAVTASRRGRPRT